jgi:hypoxanthine phosphoribosyltransferase
MATPLGDRSVPAERRRGGAAEGLGALGLPEGPVSGALEVAGERLPEAVEAVLFDAAQIAGAVRRLAGAIAADTPGEAIHLVGVLKGAIFLMADVARALPPSLEVSVDYLGVSSYGTRNRSSGEVRFVKDVTETIEGRHVVIVEDIVDGGQTLDAVHRQLARRGPASLRTCVLLDKPYRRLVPVRPDYVGFVAPDTFIVGYGLDFQEKYRHLPYLAKLHAWAFS